MTDKFPPYLPISATGLVASTAESAMLCDLPGAIRHEAGALTKDEKVALDRFYGFTPTPMHNASARFEAGGSARNMLRYATQDGLRIMAFLARYLEPGEDPVLLVAQLAARAGYDVPFDPWKVDNDA